jgi:hypothetical protein
MIYENYFILHIVNISICIIVDHPKLRMGPAEFSRNSIFQFPREQGIDIIEGYYTYLQNKQSSTYYDCLLNRKDPTFEML